MTLPEPHAQKAKKNVVLMTAAVILFLLIVWLGWRRFAAPPPVLVAEYSINGTVAAVEADGAQITLKVPTLEAAPSGGSIKYAEKTILISGETSFSISELVNGKIVFFPATVRDATMGTQLIVYTSADPGKNSQVAAKKIEIVK